MIKTELVKAVAEKSGKSQDDVREIFDMALGLISDKIKEGEEVRIPDFGVFKPHTRPASTRKVFGEMVEIAEKTTVVFKPYSKFFVYSMNI